MLLFHYFYFFYPVLTVVIKYLNIEVVENIEVDLVLIVTDVHKEGAAHVQMSDPVFQRKRFKVIFRYIHSF